MSIFLIREEANYRTFFKTVGMRFSLVASAMLIQI